MSATPESTGSAQSRLQSVLGCVSVLAFVLAGGYCNFVRTADEIGPAGVDTDGRQIWIDSLASGIDDATLTITSEWEDSNILSRLLIQEPMRTTLRFKSTHAVSEVDLHADTTLSQPATSFIDAFGERIWLRRDVSETRDEFVSRLTELGVRTEADVLAAMGFRRYEVYAAGEVIFATDLPKVGDGNVKIAGTERK